MINYSPFFFFVYRSCLFFDRTLLKFFPEGHTTSTMKSQPERPFVYICFGAMRVQTFCLHCLYSQNIKVYSSLLLPSAFLMISVVRSMSLSILFMYNFSVYPNTVFNYLNFPVYSFHLHFGYTLVPLVIQIFCEIRI